MKIIEQMKVILVILALVAIGVVGGYAIRDRVGYPECPEVEECPESEECWDCSIFDINRDGVVDIEDVHSAWRYISGRKYPYLHPIYYELISLDNTVYKKCINYKIWNNYAEKLYDVNCDDVADWIDVHLIWENINS